ncbi:MAG: glycosyl hydrolase [Thermoguttaceae bacterium]|jgi:hypothetical protein
MNRFAWLLVALSSMVSACRAAERGDDLASLEQQFRTLPLEARRWLGPLFWLHGDESRQRLETYVGKVAEGGNGCFTAESRPHVDWLGEGWWRDLGICLDAAKRHGLQMWIFDEKWWPSQSVGGKVPARYAAKRLAAAAVTIEGPKPWAADGYAGPRHVAAVAGRLAADGTIQSGSLIDLAPFIEGGKLSWQVPPGRWKIMNFSHVPAPPLNQGGLFSVDGASKDCVDWFLGAVYQPHYDHFGAEFGRTIRGFFYDEPETRGDWGTELRSVLEERKVDWKKALVAYKFALAGDDQAAARYQYLTAFAETWGRTMYGGIAQWCHRHGVKSMGHFMEHSSLYVNPDCCAGDMMLLQGHSDLGAIDAVFDQFVMGRRVVKDAPTWQTPKLASSVAHAFGKADDRAMVEIFGARGQDLTYREMKWWADHMQVSGVNFLIPHSFNPRAPYDKDCPPYFYNGGCEPRWPLYRVFADYSCRLSLLLGGGRHVCPVALLFSGNTLGVGKAIMPEGLSEALQDANYDCDWLPMSIFEQDAVLDGRTIGLHREQYRVLVVPPVEVIPYETLAKANEFFQGGGIVVGYGFLPGKSATLGHVRADIAALVDAIWGPQPQPGRTACKVSPRGGRSYFLSQRPAVDEIKAALAADARLPATLEVIEGTTDNWLHVLHRQKAQRDVFLVCNQNHQGEPRRFRFRITARGEPECWDAVRGEITALPYRRLQEDQVELALTLEPLESVLIVFQAAKLARPIRLEPGSRPLGAAIDLVRDPQPPAPPLVPEPKGRPVTLSPVKAADPFRGHCTVPPEVDLAGCRVFLEMADLPGEAARVTVNGEPAGGLIGKPCRLDISCHVRPGANEVRIVPLAPQAARLVFYGR